VVYIHLDKEASGPVTIRRIKKGGVFVDTQGLLVYPGQIVPFPGYKLKGFSFSKTSASDELYYEAIASDRPSLFSLNSPITSPDVETAILVESFDMNAQKYRTFPVPLYYVGKNNYVAFAISADTWPDTLWHGLTHFGIR